MQTSDFVGHEKGRLRTSQPGGNISLLPQIQIATVNFTTVVAPQRLLECIRHTHPLQFFEATRRIQQLKQIAYLLY